MEKNRIEWIDLSRVIAILCVVLCHCVGTFYKFNGNALQSFSLSSKIFACSLLTFGRIGVPLFLMITGYLLLDRVYNNERTRRFWNRNLKQLVICSIFWAVVGELFLILVLHQHIALKSFIFGIISLKPLNLIYFWYFPMIIGLYVLIPFAANALKDYDLDVIAKPTIFFAIVVFFAPFIFHLLKWNGLGGLSVEVSVGFSGGVYGLYMIMGYLVKKGYFKKIKTYWMALIFLISFITFVWLVLFYYNAGHSIHIYYESPFIFISSVCLFELFSRIKTVKLYNVIYRISLYSFGIFVVHDLYRMLFKPFFLKLALNNSIKFMLLYAVVIALSLITVMIISRIPKIGKYILFIK